MDGLTSWSGFPAGLKPQSFGLTSKYVIHYIMEPQTLCKSNPKMCVCVCVFVFFLLPHSPGSGSWKLKYWLKSPLLMRDTSKIRIKKKQDNKKQWISILLLFWGLYLSMWSWLLLWFCMIKKASEIIYIVKHSLSVEMRFFFINIRRTDFSGCTSLCEAKTIKTGHL